jgi:hypothetical protein
VIENIGPQKTSAHNSEGTSLWLQELVSDAIALEPLKLGAQTSPFEPEETGDRQFPNSR